MESSKSYNSMSESIPPSTNSVNSDIPLSKSSKNNQVQSTTISGSGIEDQPASSSNDTLGFKPYVEAVYSFLIHPSTKPPFTLSVEGEWGSGKSSFMLQLEQALIDNGNKTVRFNAWRHDKIESMWASFALHFITELQKGVPWYQKILAQIKLFLKRYSLSRGWLPTLKALFLSIFYIFIIYQLIHLTQIIKLQDLLTTKGELDEIKLWSLLGWTGIVIAILFFLKKVSETVGNPLTINLSKFAVTPNYVGNSAFIEEFHQDFEKIVNELSRGHEKIFVFIDDLDRAEIPKAAELMQGLNLLISDAPKLIFVIGMDREKVAAGVAAKYKDLLTFLNPDQASLDTQLGRIQAIEFGFTFIEKFIQLSFRIPQPSPDFLEEFISSLSKRDNNKEKTKSSISYNPIFVVEDGEDSEEFRKVALLIAPFFDYNPRKMKQFVNSFRLSAHIANSTGLFNSNRTNEYSPLTIPQLGKFIAIVLKWPQIINDLMEEPMLFQTIIASQEISDRDKKGWKKNQLFMNLLKLAPSDDDFNESYNMTDLNLRSLILTSPGVNKLNGNENSEEESLHENFETEKEEPDESYSSLRGGSRRNSPRFLKK